MEETKQKKKSKNKPLKKFNGQGCVYKLSGRRRKPWAVRITTGWEIVNDKHRQIREIIGYYEEKSEAETALLLHRVSPVAPKSTITLGQLYDEWSESKYKYLAKGTTDGYKAAWKRLELFKNIQFTELRSSHFQETIDKAHEEKKSRSSIEKIKAVAYMLYEYAKQNDIVNKNYTEFLNLPKEEKVDRDKFEAIEIKKIFDNVKTVEWLDTVLILIYTGMRISEMLELTKFNIDLENKIITGGIKTDAGKNRVIPIHPKIYPYLLHWYNKNGETLICNEKNRKLSARAYREKRYYEALEAIGVRKLEPHCCRHTFASLLSKANVQTLYIQKLIGHEDYSTTANIYTHTDLEELRSAIETI